MKFKYWFFGFSLLIILPGLFFLARYGLKLSIDFTGGTLLEIQNTKITNQADFEKIKTVYKSEGVELAALQVTGNKSLLLRSKTIDASQKNKLMVKIDKDFGPTVVERFETVGPTVGQEMTMKAFQALVVSAIAIIIYIAYAFREIPPPYSPWKFGFSAVVALLHDVLVLVGVFAILGHFFGVEVDVLFVTAVLTVIGFSVHDTIVVFDRVRENLRRLPKDDFENVVNISLLQTLVRSLNTSLTALFVMLAIILFGGETIKVFALALFVGILSGTYSSIFNASPLLVIWEESGRKKK